MRAAFSSSTADSAKPAMVQFEFEITNGDLKILIAFAKSFFRSLISTNPP